MAAGPYSFLSASMRVTFFLIGTLACEQALQVTAGLGAQGGKGGDLPVVPQSFFEFFHLLAVGRSFDAAVSLPAAVVDGNLFFIVIKGDGCVHRP